MTDRLGLAVGLYVPTGVLNRARAPRPGTPFFALLENRSQVVGVQVGLGVRVTDRLSLGAGVLALAALKGTINVTPDAAGRFTTSSEEQLTANFAPVFGARFHLDERWSLGATLHFASESTYDIRITNNLGAALPITLPELRVAGSAQYDPMILALEVGFRPRADLLISAQLSYDRWSSFPLPTENVLLTMPPQAPIDFHDTLIPRVAAEWSVGAFRLRAGYAFVPSPAPEATGAQALLDNDRHVLSVGAGIVAPPLHVDAWAQAHLLVSRTNDRPGTTPDIETSGSILVAGMVVGVDL
jgi:long-chain fatty acid transport protein